MFTVTEIFQSDYRVKGSKFLGYIHPVSDIREAENVMDSVKNEHPTATHHCYAYLIDPNEPAEFANDDGEPAGTAGLPILNALRSSRLINVVLIVVRYYGGTKLGKAGLIEAYGETARLTIRNSDPKKIIPIQTFIIEYDYSLQNQIDKLKNDVNLIELNAEYTESVKVNYGCPLEELQKLEGHLKAFRHLLKHFESGEKSFHILK